MPLDTSRPLTCLITGGTTSPATNPSSAEFRDVLRLVERAVAAGVALVQLREKNLSARTLYELAAHSARIAAGTPSRILVNDRADVARAARCDGVQLTTRSLPARVVRRAFGENFLIGVSAHTLGEARLARDGGADFALFGPVYDTPSKRAYGPAVGPAKLGEAALALAPFPLIGIGGITTENFREVLRAGASGVAAIRMFTEAGDIREVVSALLGL